MSDTRFTLTRLGEPLRLIVADEVLGTRKVFPVTTSRADAERLIKFMDLSGVRVARISDIPGETIEDYLAGAIRDGCVAALLVTGWRDANGSPTWHASYLTAPPLKLSAFAIQGKE